MVKSTVRFPEEVMDQVEKIVDEGMCSNKSEFQRFAVEYVLFEATDHDPSVVDFDEIRTEMFPEQTEEHIMEAEPPSTGDEEFIQIAARVRQFCRRGKISTAEEYIDTHYPASDPRSMLLDDILALYRNQVRDE
jgi:Arc/MetJ-type ribon-helix-helix transcriptional regulator